MPSNFFGHFIVNSLTAVLKANYYVKIIFFYTTLCSCQVADVNSPPWHLPPGKYLPENKPFSFSFLSSESKEQCQN